MSERPSQPGVLGSGGSSEPTDSGGRKPAVWRTGEVFAGRSRHGWNVWTGVTCVECAGCGFTFHEAHEDADRDGYTCPNCGERSADVTDD